MEEFWQRKKRALRHLNVSGHNPYHDATGKRSQNQSSRECKGFS